MMKSQDQVLSDNNISSIVTPGTLNPMVTYITWRLGAWTQCQSTKGKTDSKAGIMTLENSHIKFSKSLIVFESGFHALSIKEKSLLVFWFKLQQIKTNLMRNDVYDIIS